VIQKYALFCVLFAYLLLVVQPALPVLKFGLNRSYYAEVLCENKTRPEMVCKGKCALKKHLQELAQQEVPDDAFPIVPTDFSEPHIPEFSLPFLVNMSSAKENRAQLNSRVQKRKTEVPSPPPRNLNHYA